MSQNHHTAISASSAATTAVLNAPLGQLDSAISGILAGTTAFSQMNLGTSGGTKTIATGAITITASRHLVDTEGSAASDDLDTINGGSNGDVLVLQIVNSSRTVTIKHNTGNIYCTNGSDFTLDNVRDMVWLLYDGTRWCLFNLPAASSVTASPSVCNCRLTLETGVAVSTTDQTAKTTLYCTPYGGNQIALYDGSSSWAYSTISSDLSSTLGGLTANLPYDVFVYLLAGNLTLELVAWTNSSTRATALTKQNGVYVKSGATTRRYLGTICITGTSGQCEDSVNKRFVWNYQNRVPRTLRKFVTTDSWTYATAAWRQWNADTANQVDFVIGVAENAMAFSLYGYATNLACGIGLDGTSPTNTTMGNMGATYSPIPAGYADMPAAGKHYLAFLEYAHSGSTTAYGDAGGTYALAGGVGTILC